MAKKSFSRLVKIITGANNGGESEFTRLERFTHFWALVGKSFNRNRGPVRAAALSYTTLLALIPLLAVAISVTSSLLKKEGEQKIYTAVDKFVSNVMPPGTFSVTNSSPNLEVTNTPTDNLEETNSTPVKDSHVVAA
ncbi:MAG TPA: YhjD/YihY/BrkB family envelope integrity protein, partial [Candidatus Baltobacteraceae bacterium]|nr:YhjD/YihY/BrkB family envelope integrity protein [Candidatus Baltobacteraceae bacterium]